MQGPRQWQQCHCTLSLGFTIFGSFCPNLRSLFNRFTQTIYNNENSIPAAPIPASGSTTQTSGPSHAYLCLPLHSPEPGVFLLSRTTLMMPNAIICKMLYNHLPPTYYHLVFTLLV
jgi:hypothetical protein